MDIVHSFMNNHSVECILNLWKPLQLEAALVFRLVPCAWVTNGALKFGVTMNCENIAC